MENRDTANGKRSAWRWLLALSLIGAVVVFRLVYQTAVDRSGGTDPKVENSRLGSVEANMAMQPQRGFSLTRIPVVSRDNHSDTYLLPGDDFAAIERRLVDRVASDEQALFVMARAASACSSAVDPDWREKAATETIRRHSAWKEAFCRGRTTADEFMAYSTMIQSARQKRQAEWASKDAGNGSRLYFEAALNSDSLGDTAVAATMVTLPGLDTWDIGREDVERTSHLPKLPRYQQVALQGIECSEAGGCGPNGLMSEWLCLTTPNTHCVPGASADDMWAEEMRPDEIAIIARIQQRILDERTRRAEAQAGAP